MKKLTQYVVISVLIFSRIYITNALINNFEQVKVSQKI